MSTMSIASERINRKPAPLAYFLMFIFVFFIGILTVCYVITRHTTVIPLDEHGKPVATSSEHTHH